MAKLCNRSNRRFHYGVIDRNRSLVLRGRGARKGILFPAGSKTIPGHSREIEPRKRAALLLYGGRINFPEIQGLAAIGTRRRANIRARLFFRSFKEIATHWWY